MSLPQDRKRNRDRKHKRNRRVRKPPPRQSKLSFFPTMSFLLALCF